MKILVVDDSVLSRRMIIQALATLGYTQVSESEDGAQAFKVLADAALAGDGYELVIADWKMPNMTGLDLLKLCRQTSHLSQIKFVMVSSEQSRKSVVEALSEGASHYITKPFSPEQLREKIQFVIKDVKKKSA